ncbi:MAG: hypothetical protein EOM23_08125 [Candidatus Moranbacteria bacterium]|nr:hypothetical protein [Candidatus Moranbacteria bacterium]
MEKLYQAIADLTDMLKISFRQIESLENSNTINKNLYIAEMKRSGEYKEEVIKLREEIKQLQAGVN